MPVDKNSPQYEAYIAECKALFDDVDEKIQELRDEYSDWHGLDDPNGRKIKELTMERNRKLRKIKERYGFA